MGVYKIMHTEKQIENYLVKQMEKRLDAMAFKFTSPGKSGVPDRLFLLDWGRAVFVEVKCAKGRIASLQEYWNDKIMERGHESYFVWSYEDVDNLIGMIEETMPEPLLAGSEEARKEQSRRRKMLTFEGGN